MSSFQAGFSRVNINPPLGIGVYGYYVPRFAEGFLDDLEASVLALQCGDTRILMINVDNCGIEKDTMDEYRSRIQQGTGVAAENMFIASSHTHTGPLVKPTDAFNADEAPINWYRDFLGQRLVDAAVLALQDLKPAKMGFIVGYAPERVAYIRRYKMKDGSTWTCPPINDPNILHPIGELDQRVNVLRFDREGGDTVILMNYGLHADTVNGSLLSADWPGVMRRTLEKTLDGTKCIFFAGAQGDVGSTNIHPAGGDMNDTEISFDNEMKSPGMARFVGRALAGTVLQVYDKAEYVDVDEIKMLTHIVTVPANKAKPEELPRAHLYKKLHEEDNDADIPYTAMELTTVVAEALRMCRLENGPDEFHLELSGVKIGNVAFVGIPGEPFTGIGVGIKETEGWDMILPCCLTNGSEGYFPMQDAFAEGGYEARSSVYCSGVAEAIIDGGKQLLQKLAE